MPDFWEYPTVSMGLGLLNSISIDVDGSIGGRTYIPQRTVTTPSTTGVRLWVLLLDATARVGVLAVDLDTDPTGGREEPTIETIEDLAALTA